jgi:geranylgeranyl pyrophosphate synthase
MFMKAFTLPQPQAADMQQIERIIQERVHSQPSAVSVASTRLQRPPEGRLRAAVVLLAAGLGNYETARVLHAAAAVELLHAASQTHTDLIDEAQRRRGDGLSDALWPHGVPLMVGDYLFALAAGEMALAPDPRVISYYSQAVMELSEAALTPITTLAPLAQGHEQFRYSQGGKVAAVYAAAGKAGMACGGGTPEQIDALGRYGYAIGLAGQIASEVAFVLGGEHSALTSGPISLPWIYAATREDPARLHAALDSDNPAEQAWALAAVRRHGIEPAHEEAKRLRDEATAALVDFSASSAKHALDGLASFMAGE